MTDIHCDNCAKLEVWARAQHNRADAHERIHNLFKLQVAQAMGLSVFTFEEDIIRTIENMRRQNEGQTSL